MDRLIFVSGKVYWDLKRYVEKQEIDHSKIRLVRMEELYPFPTEDVLRVIGEKQAKEIVWLQEEPRNNGAYLYARDQFSKLNIPVRYIGRAESASPATGSPKIHKLEQSRLLEAAFYPFEKGGKSIEITV